LYRECAGARPHPDPRTLGAGRTPDTTLMT
jgi:hypothetical protein